MEVLIERWSPETSRILVESTKTGKNCFISGVFMQSEVRNRNGRVYPLQELAGACKLAEGVIRETGGIFGELDHPPTLTVNLANASHVITELRMHGNDVMGKAKLLNTPAGLIARELFDSGVKVGVSSRGAGEVNEGGLVENFQFVTVDIVATPSAQGATPRAILESFDSNTQGRKVLTLAEQLVDDEAAQKYFQKEFLKFLTQDIFAKR